MRRGHTLAPVWAVPLDALQWGDVADPTREHGMMTVRWRVRGKLPQLA
ncbi:hypothetical protein [Mycetohabitans sp. B46]